MKLTKKDKQTIKSVGAMLLALFYCVNVQSVNNEIPKHMARQDELEVVVQE